MGYLFSLAELQRALDLLYISLASIRFSSCKTKKSDVAITLPFLGLLIFVFSVGFITILVHRTVVLSSLISRINPGNPPYQEGPVAIGISGVNHATTFTFLNFFFLLLRFCSQLPKLNVDSSTSFS